MYAHKIVSDSLNKNFRKKNNFVIFIGRIYQNITKFDFL